MAETAARSARKLRFLELRLQKLSLHSRLVLLVVMTLVPLLLLVGIQQYKEYQERRELAGQRVVELAHSISLAIDRELQARIAALQALALSPTLQGGEVESFRPRLAAMVAQHWPGANALILKKDGQQLLNIAVAPGLPLPVRQTRKFMQEMFATGQPVVSDLFEDVAVGRLVVAIDVPVRGKEGRIIYSLALDPNLKIFADVIRSYRLPENWVVSIFDRQGVIIARVPNGDRFVGQKASPSFLPHVLNGRPGLVESTTLEGTPVLSALARSEKFGWSIGMGLPRADLVTPALQRAFQILGLGAFVLSISITLAILVAGQITRPIDMLRRLAASPSSAERLNPPHTGLREADEVARALRTAERHRQSSDEERQRTMNDLRASDAKLQQAEKMEAIGNLTGGMAHDFNNLLGVIIGCLDLALPHQHSPEVKSYIEEAAQAAMKGADLTQTLLAYARRQPLQPTSVNLNDLISQMAKLLARTLGAHIEISLDLAPDTWPAIVDRAQFEAALLNLATNARDAMPGGGMLSITTKNTFIDSDYAATQSDVAPGEYTLTEIADTGTGMKPEVMARIFEPFYTTKEQGRGTGLGLSMVFGFIKQSGGHLNVYSEVGKGTTFRLYLPRARAGIGVAHEKAVTLSRGAAETVLVVDDNHALLRVGVSQLSELGYRVLEADSAEGALDVMEKQAVDLLFTDAMMPGEMNGLDLMRLVRKRWPSTKVIVTSGFPKAMVDGHWKTAGETVRMLNKPYRKEELAEAVHHALNH